MIKSDVVVCVLTDHWSDREWYAQGPDELCHAAVLARSIVFKLAGYDELVAEYLSQHARITAPEDYAAALRELGREGSARALDNGLDDQQNRELFDPTDSHRIVELILVGLRNKFRSLMRSGGALHFAAYRSVLDLPVHGKMGPLPDLKRREHE